MKAKGKSHRVQGTLKLNEPAAEDEEIEPSNSQPKRSEDDQPGQKTYNEDIDQDKWL